MKPVLPFKITRFLQSIVVIMMMLIPVVLMSGQAHAVCSNPAGNEGAIIYNDAYKTLQYCDDVLWRDMSGGPLLVQSLSEGLVHHWTMDSIAGNVSADAVGGNNCTYSGTRTVVAGVRGNATNMNNAFANCGSNIAAVNGASTFTMAGWFKRGSVGSEAYMGKVGDHATTVQLSLASDGRIWFVVGDTPAGFEEANTNQNDTEWHHYALVFDGTQTGNANRLKGYVDGRQVTLTFGGTIPATSPPNTGVTFYMGDSSIGTYDDMRVYNRALSSAEVAALVGVTDNLSGLVAYWRMDELSGTTAYDLVGGNNGTMQNGLTGANTVSGRVGTALQFDGNNDYIISPTNAALNVTSVTAMAWIRPTTITSALNGIIILENRAAGDTGNYELAIDGSGNGASNDGLIKIAYFNGVWRTIYSTITPTLNQWQHVAVTVDDASNTYNFYLNGVLAGSGATPADLVTYPSTQMRIGTSSVGGFNNNFGGALDDVRVYNRALTAAEIRQTIGLCSSPSGQSGDIIYSSSVETVQFCNGSNWSSISPRRTIPNTTNLVAHYKFDHSAGTSLTDSAGSHTGTLTNFTLPAAWTAGHIGSNSLNFDGADDYVALTSPADFAFNPSAGQYTWTMWLNPDDFEEWNAVFGTFTNPDNSPMFTIMAHTTATTSWGPVTEGISVGMEATYSIYAHTTSNALVTGTWQHVAVTYDSAAAISNRYRIYVNGIDVTDYNDVYTAGSMATYTPTNARLGNDGWTGESFDGRIDDFRFYTRVLSPGEIQGLAAYGPASGSCANPTATAGMMIYNNTANVVQFCNGKDWVAAGR